MGLELKPNEVFVFGSNERGIHGAGAAKYAFENLDAQWGIGDGFGTRKQTYAIPTKDWHIKTLPLSVIEKYVKSFLLQTRLMGHQELTFKVTALGTGLAGYSPSQIGHMFRKAGPNCEFDEQWRPVLGDNHKYWGTYT